MRTLNLGILAHVDAGKTTLTERLLFSAGAIERVGSVDAGTTQTDSLDLERERGITIRSAVASFLVGDSAVNLVDTPGHPDFIAEVERVLGVLDGAILVVPRSRASSPRRRSSSARSSDARPDADLRQQDRPGGGGPGAGPRGDAPALVARRGSVRPPGGQLRPGRQDALLAEALAEHDEAILRAFVGDDGG
jgi:ribosomal protection tetracycline resistance protein